MDLLHLRLDVIDTAVTMLKTGLTAGSSGNVSARRPGGDAFLITPSAMLYNTIAPDDVVEVDIATGAARGARKPSIELELHRMVYAARPDVQAIVHAHSPVATALAAARRPLPPIIDMCALGFGGQVEVADYAPSGSAALAASAVAALGQRNAVLLANHGSLTVGDSLAAALGRCELLERVSYTYLLSQLIGGAAALNADEVAVLINGVGKVYGRA